MNGVTVNSRFDPDTGRDYKVHNGDGLNPDSCTDVYIFNSTVISQDDNIAVKSGMNEDGRRVGRPSERIRITNCRFERGLGVACGSDMSGDVRDVRVRDCEFVDTAQVGQIKTPRGRGGVVEDVHYSNCRHENITHDYGRWARAAITLDAYYGDPEPDVAAVEPVGEGTPRVRNVSFEKITTVNRTGDGILVQGLPEAPYEDIRFTNVTVQSVGEPKTVQNANGVEFENVTFERIEGD